MIWDRHGAASLPEALAASTAFPATAPPITINGHRYIDGALRAGANADLAADADLVIIAEPMAHVFGTGSAAPGAGAVIRLVPDADAIQAFGPDITSLATWAPSYRAGIRQAPQAARLIGACHPVRQRRVVSREGSVGAGAGEPDSRSAPGFRTARW
jgi:NTE family protein